MEEGSEFGLLRAELLKIFVAGDHIGEAGLLGEEFHDFNTLMKVYEIEKDEAKLGGYLTLDRFPEYLFSKYRGENLVRIAARHGGRLGEIVGADSNHGWLLAVKKNELDTATGKLGEQAQGQNLSLSKRSLLSIAKLTSIAAGVNPQNLDEIKSHEILLDYQVFFENNPSN